MKCQVKKTETGFQILSEVMEGPHEKDRSEGNTRLDRMINTLPRHRIICTVHGTDDDAQKWVESILNALNFEEPY